MRDSIKDSSILIISHQERILEIADEIIVVADGTIDRMGPRDELLPSLIGTTSAVGACVPMGGRPASVPPIPTDENGNPIPKSREKAGNGSVLPVSGSGEKGGQA
jgi:energy-coupling factor transporter ATP-binding protein EcfA2